MAFMSIDVEASSLKIASRHGIPSMRRAVLLALLMAFTLTRPPTTQAQDAIADFYKGKQIRIFVSSEAGSAYDLYARIVARHMRRFIPGNPLLLVQNLLGSGGIAAANAVYATLPQDGTVIGELQPGTPIEQILGHEGPQFEATKFNWLGNLNNEPAVALTIKPAKVAAFDDLKNSETIFGTSGPNTTEQYPAMLVNMMGARIKLVDGYPSIIDVGLAMRRGEVEGLSQSWAPFKKRYADLLAAGRINLLAQFVESRQPDLPNVPLINDLLTEKYLLPEFKPEEAKAIWRIMLLPTSISRPWVLGPQVPADRVAALRKAFNAMVADSDFLADAAAANLDIAPSTGQELQDLIAQAAMTPKSTLDKVAGVTQPKDKK
jgi:tripartite-type tricarboxylate transporter receptor subunit TctC